jgi:hypothetical protein
MVKVILGFPNYSVAKDGRMWSKQRAGAKGGRIQGETCRDGHIRMRLFNQNGSKRIMLHRLVLEAYVGPCPEGMQCRHLNGDPADNRLDNLKWGTPKENHADAIRHGTHTCLHQEGELAGNHKLTSKQVVEIKKLLTEGLTHRKIGVLYRVDKSTIGFISTGRTWKHVC